MAEALQNAVENREKLRSVLEGLAYAGIIYWQIRTSTLPLIDAVVGIVVSVVLFGLAGWLVETYDLRSAVKSLAVGAVATAYGAVLFVFGGVPPVVSLGLLAIGIWFLFDAVQVVRHGRLSAEGSPLHGGRPVPRDDVARKVDYKLRDNPLTKRELCEELDVEESAVDDALATLDERGVLTRKGSELRTSRTSREAEESDRLARVQRAVRRGASRLAQPVTVELRG